MTKSLADFSRVANFPCQANSSAAPARAAYLGGFVALLGLDSEVAGLGFRGRRRVRSALLKRSWLLRALQTQFSVTTPL